MDAVDSDGDPVHFLGSKECFAHVFDIVDTMLDKDRIERGDDDGIRSETVELPTNHAGLNSCFHTRS